METHNCLNAEITQIKRGLLNTHISLHREQQHLSAIITTHSADEMELKEGETLQVIVRPSDIILAKDFSGTISARNRLTGRIIDIIEGDPLSLVTVKIDAALLMRAEITQSSLLDMQLKIEDEVTVLVKSTGVILARSSS